MRVLSRAVLLAVNVLISVTYIAFGAGFLNITDSDPAKSPAAVVIGLLLLILLIILLVLGKSNKSAEKIFWYLGIGSPIFTVLRLLVG